MQLNYLKDSQLKEGDKIYLLTTNLRLKKPFKKLNYKKIGSFLVDKQPAIPDKQPRISYRLKLPQNARVKTIFFHISLLEPAHPDTPLQTIFYFESDEEIEYEVE